MRNAIKIIYDDGTSQDIPLAPAPVPVVTPPPVINSGIIKGGYFDWVPDGMASYYAEPFGMGWVRTWFPVRDWTKPPVRSDFNRHRTLRAQGLKVLTVFTPLEKSGTTPAGPMPTAEQAASWFSVAQVAADRAVDAWEIWNEPNLSQYNPRYGYADWIRQALAPAYSILHPKGEFVVSGGWSGGAGDSFAYMVKNGLLDVCDAVGYHPYGSTAPDQLAKVRDMRSRIGDKPLWLTEWNLHMATGNPLDWATSLVEAAKLIKPYVQAVFHFKHVYNTSQAGVAAPYDASLQKRVPWYDNTVNAMGAL